MYVLIETCQLLGYNIIILLMIGGGQMKKIINAGIYDIDFMGENKDEFMGNHPTLILKSIKNEAMFYAFPLTTYSPERWKKLRTNGCCRITTTNSIVRIDKVMVLHKSKIKNRWIKKDSFIIPTVKEVMVVYNRYIEYIKLSTNKSIKAYTKYYTSYNNFIKKLHKHFIKQDYQKEFSTNLTDKIVSFDYKLVFHLTYDDIKHIICSVLGRENVKIKPNKDEKRIEILMKNDKFLVDIKK